VVTAAVTEAEIAPSACETAVTFTVPELGIVAGALYCPEFEIVPAVESPPGMRFTSQETIASKFSGTIAVNWRN
jgi:hypothetical protein